MGRETYRKLITTSATEGCRGCYNKGLCLAAHASLMLVTEGQGGATDREAYQWYAMQQLSWPPVLPG
eukprot:scaffold342387_cov22-Prasinocladus_malaysianus.AAC.1